jgi:ribokinase
MQLQYIQNLIHKIYTMNTNRITVIGSSNTDMVVKADKFPQPGETLLGGKFFMNPGGKGANQAVAAARLGGNVTFIGKIGDDIFGKQSIQLLEQENIDCTNVFTDTLNPSGVALITLDAKGENSIVVASGSNATLSVEDIKKAITSIESSNIILMQLETPIETVEFAAQYGASKGIRVILNPAPATKLPSNLLKNLSIITPNETEAEILTGIKVQNTNDALKAAEILRKQGAEQIIITLGSAGAFVYDGKRHVLIPSLKVTPVDTTAAGDVFNGALAVALSEGKDIFEAAEFANKAAAIAVTRLGAQSSIPYRKEIN